MKPDREKVINGLNSIHAVACGLGEDECYLNSIGIKQLQTLINDATELLKAQEPIRPGIGIIHNDDGSKSYFLHCPIDGTTLDEGDRYCRKCGRKVKQE